MNEPSHSLVLRFSNPQESMSWDLDIPVSGCTRGLTRNIGSLWHLFSGQISYKLQNNRNKSHLSKRKAENGEVDKVTIPLVKRKIRMSWCSSPHSRVATQFPARAGLARPCLLRRLSPASILKVSHTSPTNPSPELRRQGCGRAAET